MPKKAKFIVVPRTQNAMKNGIFIGKGKIDFHGKTAAYVDDPTVASEIDKEHGLHGSGEVWVDHDPRYEWHVQHDGETDGKNLKKGSHQNLWGYNKSFADAFDRIFSKRHSRVTDDVEAKNG